MIPGRVIPRMRNPGSPGQAARPAQPPYALATTVVIRTAPFIRPPSTNG